MDIGRSEDAVDCLPAMVEPWIFSLTHNKIKYFFSLPAFTVMVMAISPQLF